MLKYLLMLSLVSSSLQFHWRTKRQEDGSFWWEKPAKTETKAEVIGQKDEITSRQDNKINETVLAQILSNGPTQAGKSSPHPGQCVCVPYYLCENNEIVTDGAGIIDIRKRPSANGTTTKVNKRQAPPPAPIPAGSQPAVPVDPASLVGGNCPGVTEVCCKAPQAEPIPDVVPSLGPSYIPMCGIRNADGLNVRITNFKDNEAQYGEFPWMVAVLRPTLSPTTGKENDVYQCGGSLIHPQVVLTVAHCVAGKDPKSLKIRIGEWDTQSAYEFFPHQDRQVIDAIIHEQFYPAALFNDIALLFLDSPIDLGPEADTICLPRPEDIFDGSRCFATGWGKDQFGQVGKYQHILKKIELPLVPRDICQNSLRKTRLGAAFRLHDSFLCAGGEPGKDTCKGDGGSPLVCPLPGTSKPKRYVQVGMVAWGIGCGENGIPGVYASVPKAAPWIQDKIIQRFSLDPSYFRNQISIP